MNVRECSTIVRRPRVGVWILNRHPAVNEGRCRAVPDPSKFRAHASTRPPLRLFDHRRTRLPASAKRWFQGPLRRATSSSVG
jgi:hypothetical protein